MLWLGLKKDSSGYGGAISKFQRDGTPLSAKMCAALSAECDRADEALAEIRAVIQASQRQRVKGQGRRAKPKRAASLPPRGN